MKRLLLYDLDGTLVDTRDDIARAINHMLAALSQPVLAVREIERLVGRGIERLIRDALGSDEPDRIREGVRLFADYYRQHLTESSAVYPGAVAALDLFRGATQVVLTNKSNPFTEELLERLGLRRHFAHVIAGNSGYPKKPDPAAVHWLLARCGVTPQEALLIGDSPIDVQTGRNAGIDTVILTHGFADAQTLHADGPVLLASGFGELIALARRRGWA